LARRSSAPGPGLSRTDLRPRSKPTEHRQPEFHTHRNESDHPPDDESRRFTRWLRLVLRLSLICGLTVPIRAAPVRKRSLPTREIR
jgi:hypothetical protein